MLVAQRERHHVHQLAGVSDALVVRFGIGEHDVRAAHVQHQSLHQADGAHRHGVVGREDVVAAAEEVARGVDKAAALAARHRMSAQIDEGFAVKRLDSLVQRALDAAHVG